MEELVTVLEDESLKKQWVKDLVESGLAAKLSSEEFKSFINAFFSSCLSVLRTGSYEEVQKFATTMAKQATAAVLTTEEVFAAMFEMRDVFGRKLVNIYQSKPEKFQKILDIYLPTTNKIYSTVALAFIEEQKRLMLEQQQAMLVLSTPVLQIRDEILVLPLIGTIDSPRAQQIVEELLNKIAEYQASIVIIDLTGVPIIDSLVANHLIKTVQAAKMLGAETIITGISPPNAQTLVSIGIDTTTLITKNNLRAGLKTADEMLQLQVIKKEEAR